MVVEHPLGDRVDAKALEHSEADLRVALEHEPLGIGERAWLAQDLLRDRELAEVVEAAREAGQLDLLLVEADALGQAGGQVRDAARVAARVGVAQVDGLGEARRGAVARRPVGPVGETTQLCQLDDIRAVEVHPVAAVLLGPVEGAVGEADQLVTVERLLGEARNAGADGDRADELQLELADPLHDRPCDGECLARVVVGQEERELVSTQPEGLAVLAELRGEVGEQPVALRMAVEVVDALEVVDVDQAEREGRASGLGLHELALEPVVEMSMVAEAGQRIGECETHGPERVIGRALVERDCEQRTHEHRREER